MVTLSFLSIASGKTSRVVLPDPCEVVITRVSGVAEPTLQEVGPQRFEMQVDLPSLSSPHAKVFVQQGEVWVEDLQSRNGTYLRLEAGLKKPLRDRTSWLGVDLAVRVEGDRWLMPEALEALSAESLRDLIQDRLRGRGLKVELGDATLGSYTLTGDPRHLVVRPETRNRTVDVEDGTWVQVLLNTWNAAQAVRRSAVEWRFGAHSLGRRRAKEEAARVAPSSLPVLLIGPVGVGKSLLAQDIHEHSTAARGPFQTVQCATLRPELALGLLVGMGPREVRPGPGYLESAQDGTLYLEGVDALPPEAQEALERYLSTGVFLRVGEGKERHGQVRIIASCERDPRIPPASITECLYNALSVVRIDLPAPTFEDLTRLTEGFLQINCERFQVVLPPGDVSTLTVMASTRVWPRHVDDLRSSLEQLFRSRTPGQPWLEAWAELLRNVPSLRDDNPNTPLPVQPAVIGRYLADAIFLSTALSATKRSDVPKKLQMTFQGADLRYRALNVDYNDRASMEARLQQLLADMRAAVEASPAVESLLRRVLQDVGMGL